METWAVCVFLCVYTSTCVRVWQPRHGFIKVVVRGAWWDRWRAEDKDEGRTEGERRELPPLVISAGKGV